MDFNARVDVSCGRKDGRTDRLTDGRKTGRLHRNFLKQVRQKRFPSSNLSSQGTADDLMLYGTKPQGYVGSSQAQSADRFDCCRNSCLLANQCKIYFEFACMEA